MTFPSADLPLHKFAVLVGAYLMYAGDVGIDDALAMGADLDDLLNATCLSVDELTGGPAGDYVRALREYKSSVTQFIVGYFVAGAGTAFWIGAGGR